VNYFELNNIWFTYYLTAHEADRNLWHCNLTQMFRHMLTFILPIKQSKQREKETVNDSII